jgi:hypothetical protein
MKRIFSMFVGLAVALSALQAQNNTVTVGDVKMQEGETAVISVVLDNETAFNSFQMDLTLPEGFQVATTINEDDEEVLDIALNADRKKSTHTLAYNVLNSGAIRIASYSSTNATYKGNSGEIVQIRIEATEAAVAGTSTAVLSKILFTTPEPVGFDFEDVKFQIAYAQKEITPLEIVSVVPAEGTVNQLDRIIVQFNQKVQLSYDENWQALSYEIKLYGEAGEEYILTHISAYPPTDCLEYAVNAEWNGYEYISTPITAEGTYTLDFSQIVVDYAEGEGIDEWGYPTTVWHGKNGRCEGSSTWIVSAKEVLPSYNVAMYGSQYGRCIWNGNVVEPGAENSLAGTVEQDEVIKFYFIPLEGYMASSMKRNGEVVAIRNNVYEESVTEDVAFTDVNYVTIVDTLVVTETVVDTLVQTETIVDTLVVTEIVVDTLVLTETIVDTMLVEVVDTVCFETIDTIFVPEYEALPIPVITCDSGVVTITCSSADVAILYAINGDPMEGSIYTGPFEAPTDAVISAVAVKRGELAVLNLAGEGVEQAQMRVVSRRYYNDSGVAVTSPEEGITIVVAEYEDGSTRVYKMVKR